MKKTFTLFAMAIAVILMMASTAPAVEVEKLSLDTSTSLDSAFDTGNLNINGDLAVALLHNEHGGALGVRLQPRYIYGTNEISTTAGVYFRPVGGLEVYANKDFDIDHFSDSLNGDGVTAGVRLILIDKDTASW